MNSSNPAMGVLNKAASGEYNFGGIGDVATVKGATTKAIMLVALTFVVGFSSMQYSLGYMIDNHATPNVLLIASVIASVIIAFVTIFKPHLSNYTAPAYAVAEGIALGCISAVMEIKYEGIVATAVMSTFVVVMCMLALWKFGVIVPTARFRAVITGAVCGVAVLYLLNIIMSFIGIPLIPQSGPISIIISLIVCTIAAFSLVLDFEMIGSCVSEQGLPKYFESYCAFSLLVTICWLYLEILKLLSKRE